MSTGKFDRDDIVVVDNRVTVELTDKVGRIIGIASELPVMGKMYIVDFGKKLTLHYPFSATVISEHSMRAATVEEADLWEISWEVE